MLAEKAHLIRDPFYNDIVDRIDRRLDPELFERCATDLLRDEWPTLVPVRGGTDAGMDGAIAEGEGPAFPLVCTTAKDVIGNLTRSLDSYLRDGGSRRQVVLVISRELTQRRRRNLEKRAEEKGFVLFQVYDQAAMAVRLYRNPAWCLELLNLTGAPSALSVVPLTRRPLLGEDLIGREDDLEWLRASSGDRLLKGPPGSGKTFLLRALALEGWGLFVTSDDPTGIANALRNQESEVVIVDDAHLDVILVAELRRLREEVGADFSIVAMTWNRAGDEVADILNLTEADTRELRLLARDEIVEVVHNSGIRGPNELVRAIVDQAEGRPGLAVTLSYLCLRGGVSEVALGSALRRNTVAVFEGLVGEETAQILAAFALGGDAGMRPTAVARTLEIPRYRINTAVGRLAAGGVVDSARCASPWSTAGASAGEEYLAVRPPSLRYTLVRDVFFTGPPIMPLEEIIEAAPNVTEVARTLVRAAGYGASVPPDLLTTLLERTNSSEAWAEYAALGEAEATYVLTNHPEITAAVADVALETAPRAVIPRLLQLAIGDERPTNPFPDHPIRRLEGWVQVALPGGGQAVPRRELLVEMVNAWLSGGGDRDIGVCALRMAMSPAFNDYISDPGSGRRVTFRRGLLLPDELSRLKELWLVIVELLGSLENVPWRYLFEAVHDWAYPSLHTGGTPPEEVSQDTRAFAGRMLEDMARVCNGHPGVLHKAAEYARELDCHLEVTPDPEFETLFPAERLRAGDWQAVQEGQLSAVRELAERWGEGDPMEVAERVAKLEAAAGDVNKTYSRHTPVLCEEIAGRTERPMEWLRALLDNGASPDLVTPFLSRSASSAEEEWEEVARECLRIPALEFAAIYVTLTTPDPPPRLLSDVSDRLGRFANAVEVYCIRGQVPEETLTRLLRHEDAEVAAAAAAGEWHADPRGGVREGVESDWRAAMLEAPTDQHLISDILGSDPTLAHDWLLRRLSKERILGDVDLKPTIGDALSALDREQKLSILRSISSGSMYHSLVAALVGDDLELYGAFLSDGELTQVHLWPLVSMPTGSWSEKARLALAAGFSAEQVAGAAFLSIIGWSGNESDMWEHWIDQFSELLSHEDEGVRSVAERGVAYARERKRRALGEERNEAVYGF